MMEIYKEIINDAHDVCNTPNIPNTTAKTPTPKGQQLELQSLAREFTNQIKVKSEENQLDKAEILRVTSGNARRLKS